jgi:threonine dehydrogenase-like Zn-dependent dehydrogenase
MDLPSPADLKPDEVIFRVSEIGVCGTDRELARFRFGAPPVGETRLILGHEALGQVRVAGSAVEGLKPGDWVAPMIRRACSPPCRSCAAQRPDLCMTGRYGERGIMGLHGYFTSLAVDAAANLQRVPDALAAVGILAEPLSVVEKAIGSAMRAHPGEPRKALVIGAGPVGILAGLALQVRGIEVQLMSMEPSDHPRARLAREAGFRYIQNAVPEPADIVIEAAGSSDAARAMLDWLAPLGVGVLLGSGDFHARVPGTRFIVENLTLLGIVNAGPQHFRAAIEDLARIDRRLLEALIHRKSAASWRESLAAVPVEPKIVHCLSDSLDSL